MHLQGDKSDGAIIDFNSHLIKMKDRTNAYISYEYAFKRYFTF